MRYHVNNEGEAGPCRAERGQCPFGEEVHRRSLEEARAAYEEQQGSPFAVDVRIRQAKLESLGVEPNIAATVARGATVGKDEVEAMLNHLPVYLNGRPNEGERVRIARRRYDEQGQIVSVEISTGIWHWDKNLDENLTEKLHRTGKYFVDQDGEGFNPNEHGSAEEIHRAAQHYFSSFRVRSEGAVAFAGSNGPYFEHDTVETIAPSDQPLITYDEVREIVARKRREERQQRRRERFPFLRN